MEAILFWVFSALSVAGAAGVVLNLRNAVAAALWLVVSMIALAVLFIMLHAEFIGLIQIMVYAGAIVVLFLFVIMLLNIRSDGMGAEDQPILKLVATLLGLALTAKLATLVATLSAPWPAVAPEFGTVRSVGRALYTDFLLPFEISGVLLLAAIVGAVILAKREID
jgi:NADH-quinone oxidoreductase subunit J